MYLTQELYSHFQQCYQYLLSHAKVNNVLQCDTGPEQFSFFLNHLQCMSPQPRKPNECPKSVYICHLKVHDKTITVKD